MTAELLLPEVPNDRRALLAQELVRLAQQRTELLGRIDELTVRAQQLASMSRIWSVRVPTRSDAPSDRAAARVDFQVLTMAGATRATLAMKVAF